MFVVLCFSVVEVLVSGVVRSFSVLGVACGVERVTVVCRCGYFIVVCVCGVLCELTKKL
jgi:hypothetical protein